MRRFGLMTLLLALTLVPRGAAALPDHLKCYKIKDPIKFSGILDLDTPQFGAESGCTASKAKLFCVPATKTVLSAEDRATGLPITPLPLGAETTDEDRVCYKVRCPLPVGAVPDQVVTDQFGTRTLTRFKAAMVCTPAVKGTAYCGNGMIDPGEDCEGVDLGGATCQTLGLETGTLACSAGCSFDRSGCACSLTITFPASGQTTAYTADKNDGIAGAVPVPDDGTVQAGTALAYTDNGDGTITDLNTGLMWEKKSNDGSLHDQYNSYRWSGNGLQETIWDWLDDVNTEGGTGFAGFNDWRLPNISELQSLVNREPSSPPSTSAEFDMGCSVGCSVITCSCTLATFYWSSTTFAQSSGSAWYADFNNGVLGPIVKTTPGNVRAVRGGSL